MFVSGTALNAFGTYDITSFSVNVFDSSGNNLFEGQKDIDDTEDKRLVVVMPGTIIARAFANDWSGDLKWQVQNDEITEPSVPEMNALYAVDPWFPSYRVNTTIGVTAINVTPGTLNLVGGNGVLIKTPGLDFEEMVRREPSSMVMSLTS